MGDGLWGKANKKADDKWNKKDDKKGGEAKRLCTISANPGAPGQKRYKIRGRKTVGEAQEIAETLRETGYTGVRVVWHQ